jgi:anti-anti-sigma regulatory factor
MVIEVGGTVQIESRHVDDHTLVALSGPLSLSTAPRVGDTLTKLLARNQPVVVDLSGLELGWCPAVEVFSAALQAGGGWPLARMVLFGANADLAEALHTVRVDERVPLTVDYSAARGRIDNPPQVVLRQVGLPNFSGACVIARAAAAGACRDWELPDLAPNAGLIAGELVLNAVEHARCAPQLTLTLHRSGITISVRDGLRCTPPRPRLRCVGESGGWGLLMVTALATRWGVIVHDDGKTVWVELARSTSRLDMRP